MEWRIPGHEREILRELAQKQAEYTALPVMDQRRRMWLDLNDGVTGARPPLVIETGTFDRDFLPESAFRCVSETGQRIEGQLLRNVRNHEMINDDKVIPDSFDYGWFVDIDEFGLDIPRDTRPDAQGVETGYRFIHPITDLERDLPRLKPASCSVDRARTEAWRAFLEGLIGDILPVRLRTGLFGNSMLTHRVIELMGMEAFFIAMHDQPELLHRLMAYLRDNALGVMRWAQTEGLLRTNGGNQDSFGSSYNFTAALGSAAGPGGGAALENMWGCANSQESIGISPAMYSEFCFPYYRDVCEPMGRLYYGCCEPAHPFWDDIRRLPHLSKVSVNKWTDEDFVGEALRGKGIIFSRKPDPTLLGLYPALDEDAWAAHIRATLKAASGCQIEFIVRDVYTVHGDLSKPRRAVELARREIDLGNSI